MKALEKVFKTKEMVKRVFDLQKMLEKAVKNREIQKFC